MPGELQILSGPGSAYDMDGNPISLDEYMRKSKEDPTWRSVARTDFLHHTVSTIHLGFDHGWSGGTPVIFETMVFPSEHQERYSTREAALAGHARIVAELEKRAADAAKVVDGEAARTAKKLLPPGGES